jgi:CRISPR/Cas system-associated exonuclease Cas4 (RecB family)
MIKFENDSSLAIGSFIHEILHSKSHDRLTANFSGYRTRVNQVRRMNSLETLLSNPRKARSLRGQI